MIDIRIGDCREHLKAMVDESVHCVVTSPPYYALRDYGVVGQLGLEPTPDEYIRNMVAVLREVRRVLRCDGTLWLNIGDSYASSGRGGNPTERTSGLQGGQASQRASMTRKQSPPAQCKAKDLIGIPWMLAFALRADGWYLRQDIIWAKPNPMPESVRDRCTKSHEYLFLLSKSLHYHFNAEAIAEPLAVSSIERLSQPNLDQQAGSNRVPGKTNGRMKAVRPRFGGSKYGDDDSEQYRTNSDNEWMGSAMRNKRSVWSVATQPFKQAHFATFPPALIEPCILAGCPPQGCVLDPFGGAGTTGLVAQRLQRDAILLELNPQYALIAQNRIRDDAPLLTEFAAPVAGSRARTTHSANLPPAPFQSSRKGEPA